MFERAITVAARRFLATAAAAYLAGLVVVEPRASLFLDHAELRPRTSR